MTRNPSSRASSSADRGLRRRTRRFVRAGALAAVVLGPGILAAADPPDEPLVLQPFPLRAVPSFPGGLFHWIDSLAGTSVGKTVPAHREEFVKRFGHPSAEDREHIAAFVAARAEDLKRLKTAADREGLPVRGSAMLGVFCAAASVEQALAEVKPQLSPEAYRGLADAIAWFRPKYETIWDGGAVPRAFVERARRDPAIARLESILTEAVSFYGVDPSASAPPRFALVPVPPGYGTHAEAIGDVILIEIRPGDGLADEASVIVHESSHWLWSLVAKERQDHLTAYAGSLDDTSRRTFRLFGEAIPTALGQGVADHRFRPASWSIDGPWYHVPDVDACAKAIYPAVRGALETGGRFDEEFLRVAMALAEGRRARAARFTPRSP